MYTIHINNCKFEACQHDQWSGRQLLHTMLKRQSTETTVDVCEITARYVQCLVVLAIDNITLHFILVLHPCSQYSRETHRNTQLQARLIGWQRLVFRYLKVVDDDDDEYLKSSSQPVTPHRTCHCLGAHLSKLPCRRPDRSFTPGIADQEMSPASEPV